jgi:hypothetical protein
VTEYEAGLAANALVDRLIDGIIFVPLDMTAMIAQQLSLAWGDRQDENPLVATVTQQVTLATLQVDIPTDKPLPVKVQAAIEQGRAS